MQYALNIKIQESDFYSAGIIPLKGATAEKVEAALIEIVKQEQGADGDRATVTIEPIYSTDLIPFVAGYAEGIESCEKGGQFCAIVTLFYDDGEEIESRLAIELTHILEV